VGSQAPKASAVVVGFGSSRRMVSSRHVLRNDGVGGSNPSCGTSKKTRQIRTLWAFRRIAAVRVFGNSHDFLHVEDTHCSNLIRYSGTRWSRPAGRRPSRADRYPLTAAPRDISDHHCGVGSDRAREATGVQSFAILSLSQSWTALRMRIWPRSSSTVFGSRSPTPRSSSRPAG
jgi:hypothetical protein